MADKTTYIKLDRNIIRWGWFQSPKIVTVFIWLLVKANIKEGHFQRDIIKRGSLATSNAHIAEACGLTIQNVRTALLNLEETGEIVRIQRNHYQIISIVNYEAYQSDSTKTRYQLTGNQQATNKQLTTIKEYKNDKNGKKEKYNKKNSAPSPTPLYGGGDVAKATLLKPIDEGTVEDIPAEYRDFCNTYAEYWRFRNR